MKKAYRQPKHKAYSLMRARKEMERRQKNNERGTKQRDNPTKRKKRLSKGERKELIAPSVFSLILNTEETLDFFHRLHKHAQEGPVSLDFGSIYQLTPATLLYLIALFDKIGFCDIHGNVPGDPACRELFLNSGFLKYVTCSYQLRTPNPNIMKIAKENKVLGPRAAELLEFCSERLGNISNSLLPKRNYDMMVELMENTRQHAAPKGEEPLKWYLMGTFDEEHQAVHISFLDNGLGIPETIRKKPLESVAKLMRSGSQYRLVEAAFDGQARTQTKKPYRGKGLPSIKRHMDEGYIRDLVIVSNRAYLNFGNVNKQDLATPLKGTLYSWMIKRTSAQA